MFKLNSMKESEKIYQNVSFQLNDKTIRFIACINGEKTIQEQIEIKKEELIKINLIAT